MKLDPPCSASYVRDILAKELGVTSILQDDGYDFELPGQSGVSVTFTAMTEDELISSRRDEDIGISITKSIKCCCPENIVSFTMQIKHSYYKTDERGKIECPNSMLLTLFSALIPSSAMDDDYERLVTKRNLPVLIQASKTGLDISGMLNPIIAQLQNLDIEKDQLAAVKIASDIITEKGLTLFSPKEEK